MFTKQKQVGGMNVRAYKKVIDWEAVWATIFLALIGIAVLANI